MFTKQDPMRRVLYSLVPIFIWSVYLYGWRVVAMTGFIYLLGILAEYVFEKGKNKKVSEAVLVSCALYALSMPPGVPFWAAGVGILFAVIFGKEVYGGFGRNVYNPAITGRTFAYISFPLMLQTTWMLPGNFGLGSGMNRLIQGSTWLEAVVMLVLVAVLFWYITSKQRKSNALLISVALTVAITVAFYVTIAYAFPFLNHKANGLTELDAVAMATPIEVMRGIAQQNHWQQTVSIFGWNVALEQNNPLALLFGIRVGSMGEGAIFLIILAGIYLLWTKTANWRPMLVTIVSALGFTVAFYYSGIMDHRFPIFADHRLHGTSMDQWMDILSFMMAGSLLFAAVFMSTDPVSAPKKFWSQWLYGIIIGGLTITIRVFAGFPEGVSFAILTANTFASLIDEVMPSNKKKAGAKKPAVPAKAGGTVASAGGEE
ncbi:MAG: RnfABCDGE type electron transport complex subunit D [Spirochaetales bacterium]